jgi:hypothetical protein
MVVAIAQEDKSLEEHGRILKKLKEPPFDVVADLNREITTTYDRTTAYLIDKEGVVRQVFPMLIHARPSWDAIVGEIETLVAEQKAASKGE